jgi:hypothetical protein
MCCNRLLIIALLLTPLAAGASPEQRRAVPSAGTGKDATAIVAFTRAVNAYANLHRTVAASLPPEEMCADPEERQRRVEQLAEALRTERTTARAGDVLTPAIASLFKRRLTDAVRRPVYQRETLVPPQAPEDALRLEVNDAFPWIVDYEISQAILVSLIPLPAELEYRFVDRDLVLLDVGANLIVDILEDALPMMPTGPEAIQPRPARPSPCLVHPDLPMCWS